ncbi:hypothetical protein GW17_00026776 [Ensete ventricosum]|uniref:Uncharacterized protein n=1 Tax=Ensete ventricosum TaxID=4639 RepID=A0A444EH34_ENSVE|nr:hypothetical protein GW17_00026776 [Ensete ventricosum]RZR73794.1 hypothetical protein BHM03_00028131 [Ensete ventricosum]
MESHSHGSENSGTRESLTTVALKETYRSTLQPQHCRPWSGATLDSLRAPVVPPEHARLCSRIHHSTVIMRRERKQKEDEEITRSDFDVTPILRSIGSASGDGELEREKRTAQEQQQLGRNSRGRLRHHKEEEC